jgi:hypothetical protein
VVARTPEVTVTAASPPAVAPPHSPPRLSASQLLPIEDGRLVDTDESETGLDPISEERMSRIRFLRDRCRRYFRGNKVYGPLSDDCVRVAEEDFRRDKNLFLDISELMMLWPDPSTGELWRPWDRNVEALIARTSELMDQDNGAKQEVKRRYCAIMGPNSWPYL